MFLYSAGTAHGAPQFNMPKCRWKTASINTPGGVATIYQRRDHNSGGGPHGAPSVARAGIPSFSMTAEPIYLWVWPSGPPPCVWTVRYKQPCVRGLGTGDWDPQEPNKSTRTAVGESSSGAVERSWTSFGYAMAPVVRCGRGRGFRTLSRQPSRQSKLTYHGAFHARTHAQVQAHARAPTPSRLPTLPRRHAGAHGGARAHAGHRHGAHKPINIFIQGLFVVSYSSE